MEETDRQTNCTDYMQPLHDPRLYIFRTSTVPPQGRISGPSAVGRRLLKSRSRTLYLAFVKHLAATRLGYPVFSRPRIDLKPVLVGSDATAVELKGIIKNFISVKKTKVSH